MTHDRHPDTVLLAELEDLLNARHIDDRELLVNEAWLAAARAGRFDAETAQPVVAAFPGAGGAGEPATPARVPR